MILFKLVENTPYRLRYLAFQDGVISSPPLLSDGFAVIPNDGGPSPDLLTDLANDPVGPLARIVRARLDGLGAVISPPGTPLTQAQARALLLSDDPTNATLTNNTVPRALIVSQCSGRSFNPLDPFDPGPPQLNWILSSLVDFCLDANVDADGDPIVEVRSGLGFPGFAYIDIHERHTYDL